MPEALVILFVFAIAGGAYLFARFQVQDPSRTDHVEDLKRLTEEHAWLEQRLGLARKENWDRTMIAPLVERHSLTARRLAQANPSLER